MTLRERYDNILSWFGANKPNPAPELHYDSEFHLLIAVILSAQCTDKRVNLVTPELFKVFPDAETLAKASVEQVLEFIKSVSYPNAKAKHLIGMAKSLVENFGGEVPKTVKELQSLPGVGRKTANVVASICFNAPVIAVDTHVFRVAHRLGLSSGRNPQKVEDDLTRNIPENIRGKAHHWIILHGRHICTARQPFCEECGLREWCNGYKENRFNNIRDKQGAGSR